MSKEKSIVTVLTVKTDESQQTIKGLKKEIADLKKQYDSAVIGSEEFEKVSKELATAQANLKTVMADGKKTTDAVEGSYNHLTATMAELKKEWKATADEVKRNDLAQQIDAINTELKDMDASIGNFQRNVGDYTNSFKDAFEQQQKSTENVRIGLDGLQKTASGLASGYAAVQGTLNLLNIESTQFEQAMIKVQSAMAIAQGIGGLKDLIEGGGTLITVFKNSVTGVKAFIRSLTGVKAAIAATGIGIFVVLLGELYANWEKVAEWIGITTEKQKKHREEIERAQAVLKEYNEKVGEIASKSVTNFNLLVESYKNLKTETEKTKWITDNKEEFNKLGIAVNNLNDAEKIFIENSDLMVDAMIKRAMATAKEEELARLTSESIQALNEANARYSKITPVQGGERSYNTSHSSENEILGNDGFWYYTDEGAEKHNENVRKGIYAKYERLREQIKSVIDEILRLKAESNIFLNGGNTDSGGSTGFGGSTGSGDTFTPIKQSGVLEGLSIELQMEEDMFKESRERIFQTTKEYIQKQIEEERRAAEQRRLIEEQVKTAKLDIAKNTLNSLSSIIGEQTAVGKAAAVAATTIDTYQSATAAYKAMAGIPVVGPALGAAAAAAAVISGIANVKRILSVSKDGSNASSIVDTSTPRAATPNINLAESMPVQFTRELLSDTETTNLNQAQRVIVLESDISDTQRKVEVAESNSSF